MNPLGILLHVTTLLFVALKLTGQIAWAWWWVLLPSYGPLLVYLFLLLLIKITYWCMSPEERRRADAIQALEDYADALGRRR